jgi:membrane-associated phospholipid phosphatase
MGSLDAHISLFFSALAAQHPAVTSFFSMLASSYFFRGQVMILMFFWVWFYPGPETRTRRQVLISTLVACVLALAIGRLMVSSLPVRLRPNDNPVFHFTVAAFSPKDHPESSFPSDHAVLFIALATGIFLASRRAGSVALGYAVAVICFPRLWLGFHFLSDLLVGAFIGAGFVLLFNWHKLRSAITRPLLAVLDSAPQIFYTALFLFSYQVAEIFDPPRNLFDYLHRTGNVVVSMLGH